MLIKKRLVISNILMIAIPSIVALLIVFVSLAAIWIPSVQRNNIGVRDLEDFERTGTFMLTQVEGSCRKRQRPVAIRRFRMYRRHCVK